MKKTVCAGGFLIKDNKFLFGKRSEKKLWAAGKWDIVGGHSKKNELPFDTLKRETQEEVGVIIKNARLLLTTDVFDESINEFFTYYIYVVTEFEGKPINCSKEHSEIHWFIRKELNNLELALDNYPTLIDNWQTTK